MPSDKLANSFAIRLPRSISISCSFSPRLIFASFIHTEVSSHSIGIGAFSDSMTGIMGTSALSTCKYLAVAILWPATSYSERTYSDYHPKTFSQDGQGLAIQNLSFCVAIASPTAGLRFQDLLRRIGLPP